MTTIYLKDRAMSCKCNLLLYYFQIRRLIFLFYKIIALACTRNENRKENTALSSNLLLNHLKKPQESGVSLTVKLGILIYLNR